MSCGLRAEVAILHDTGGVRRHTWFGPLSGHAVGQPEEIKIVNTRSGGIGIVGIIVIIIVVLFLLGRL